MTQVPFMSERNYNSEQIIGVRFVQDIFCINCSRFYTCRQDSIHFWFLTNQYQAIAKFVCNRVDYIWITIVRNCMRGALFWNRLKIKTKLKINNEFSGSIQSYSPSLTSSRHSYIKTVYLLRKLLNSWLISNVSSHACNFRRLQTF